MADDAAETFAADMEAAPEGLATPRLRRMQESRQASIAADEISKLPRPTDEVAYGAVQPGSRFMDPEGQVRIKPYQPKDEKEFEAVPEGAAFVDPSGEQRVKPKYEPISFTSQLLFNMATNDKEKMKALELGYPGKVKRSEGTNAFYIDDNGVKRKPKGFTESPGAFMAAEAAPVLGNIVGDIGGGALGFMSPVPGGLAAGTVAGGGVGAAFGQGFNDLVLQIAGVYDRSGGEELANLGLAGAVGAAGSAVGLGIAAAKPVIKNMLNSDVAARATRWALGAEPEGLSMAAGLAEKGVLPPPSGWAKEAPHLQNLVEVFDPAFHTNKPLLESATKHYETTGKEILESLGAKVPDSLTKPIAAVSREEAGTALLKRAQAESAAADANLRVELEAKKAALQAQLPLKQKEHEASVAVLNVAADESRKAAEKLIKLGFDDIQKNIETAMASAKAGHNSGDLWWGVGEKLKAVKQGIAARASKMYGEADIAAGGHLPDSSRLAPLAEDFLGQLPENFRGKYPDIVAKLEAFSEKLDAQGQIIREATTPTFGQLHELRSIMRSNIDYHDLTPGIREGVYKFFAKAVDEVLHDPKAVPELKVAASLLDKADAFYRENMRPLTDKHIQAVVSGLESGLPADPKLLFDTLVREGRSDLTKKVAELVGPNLWAGVKAADVQEMIDLSKTLIPGQIDGTVFARQVLDRYRNNMLEAVHGKEASAKLLKQAQDISMLEGKLDVDIRPRDTVSDIIAKARDAAAVAKEAAKKDPLRMLNGEMKKIEAEQRSAATRMQAVRTKYDPLAFLYKPTTGAIQAVDFILKNEDLVLATAARFGATSPEFSMLRQVWAEKLLRGTLEPGQKLAQVSPEIQQIMFPGVTFDQMHLLAKEMEFLLSSKGVKDTAKSMAATSRVEHPWSNIAGRGGPVGELLSTPLKVVPFADAAGRGLLGKYYGFLRNVSTNPTFLRWLEKGLKGGPESREAVREVTQRAMQMGGAAGGGGAQALYQSIGAREAPDGKMYVEDPDRPGKYLRVDQ